MTMIAVWNGKEIARSENTIIVEGNHYFPIDDVNSDVLKGSNFHTTCPWKGKASYYTITIDGKDNQDAAWYYSSPKEPAKQIKDHIAFWRGVDVKEID